MKAKYAKENLELIVKNCKSVSEVLRAIGNPTTGGSFLVVKKYIKLYNIDVSHFYTKKEFYEKYLRSFSFKKKIQLKDILVENSKYTNNSYLKKRLYDDNIKQRKCELCGQGEIWKERRMSLILDHQNGIHTDCRLINLRIICPNCNATLETHCRGGKYIERNKKEKIKRRKLYLKSIINKRKCNRPSYKKLKSEVEKYGFVSIGKKYGVSDNSIRKWIKCYEKYNI